MLNINLVKKGACFASFIFMLCGCGATQTIIDDTNSIFYKQVKTLHLDFKSRAAMNTDNRENNSLSLSVMVRIYQLKDRQSFDKIVYLDLLNQDRAVLGDDLLAMQNVLVKPGSDVSFDMPMDENTKFVAVVGLFRAPDIQKNSWKQVLSYDDLDPDEPRVFELIDNQLKLKPEAL